MVDAVYFKGLWADPFKKALTEDKPFQLATGNKISHPRMQRSASFAYFETRAFQFVALPYRPEGVTAYVLLPRKPLAKFLAELTPAHWSQWIANLRAREGYLELPRFQLETTYDLKPLLESLGIHRAFSPNDNFPNIAPEMFVSRGEQTTYVDVNEEGTEAVAATVMIIGQGIVNLDDLPRPFEMIVDRPFLFVIREDNTGAILFLGAINDPRGN